MNSNHPAYVYDAVRLPRARVRKSGGTLADVPPVELIGRLLEALDERCGASDVVDDVVLGISTVTGEQSGNIARAAVQWAGWPDHVSGGVVSRLCCSGLDAVETGAMRVATGNARAVVAGGVESMSRVPMFADSPPIAVDPELGERTGFVTIGVSADLTAARYGFTREQLDEYAVSSHHRAAQAPAGSSLVATKAGDVALDSDEGVRADVTVGDLAALPALFGDDPAWERVARQLPGSPRPATGLHTVATAPQLVDGASAVLIGDAEVGSELSREPRAQIVAAAQSAVRSPLLTAPVDASTRALERAGITAADLDVVEVNESFAVTPLMMIEELDLDPVRVNAFGGALAVGHPLGATGGILVARALDRLERTGGEHALVTIPAALGLGAALVLRRC
ncbi:acetyl-CoA C-acyltransferase [Rhodococcus rhodochrous]|uniref:Acetyl-CoA C-acetyltransferase n=1 Tax=Rhodococcus rhodochrous J45 TaxID=935266 RepID=A0A562ERD8_RHORH|nr:acetyl-CoA C-acyltransferase [Rhodococcus rhodochrous]TWH24616.1 acetyl-CoA C-acetyltransferase [Rhodococcus rhodochrous J45]